MTSRWCVGLFFELPLSDVTVVDGEKSPRLLRGGHACRRGHVVRRHVVHGARFARRRRLLLTGYRGERCLAVCPSPSGFHPAIFAASQLLTVDHSFVPRTPYDRPSAPRGPLEVSDVTRSNVTLSWLAPTSNGGATIVAHVHLPLS